MRPGVTVLALADSDSYVKWGAALLSEVPPDWQTTFLVLASPALPSAGQLDAALAGSSVRTGGLAVVDLPALAVRVAKLQPDVVLLSLRGPLIKVSVRAIVAAMGRRPVFVTGLPGISVPANKLAISHRAQTDLFVLHSRREIRGYQEIAERVGIGMRFGLATLPFLPPALPAHPTDGDLVFADQAKVPWSRRDRLEVLGWLAEHARRHPHRKVIIKVRALPGEAQTHMAQHDYAELVHELEPAAPANLVFEAGSMVEHLTRAVALVTVSSTAAIEAVAMGVPVIAIDDFGVRRALINTVFEGSDLLASSEALIEGDFRHPNPEWMDDNYFHPRADTDWLAQLERLLDERDGGDFVLKAQRYGAFGGPLRHAWDRRRALGSYDRSPLGGVALVIGTPARFALKAARRLRGRARKVVRREPNH